MRIYYLELRNFYGFPHWYASIRCRDEEHSVPVKTTLSKAQAKLLTEPDFVYNEGDVSERFLDRDSAIDAGKKLFESTFRKFDDDILFLGSMVVADPQPMLYGPQWLEELTNKAYTRMEKLGWYDGGHEDEADEIMKEWYDTFNKAVRSE